MLSFRQKAAGWFAWMLLLTLSASAQTDGVRLPNEREAREFVQAAETRLRQHDHEFMDGSLHWSGLLERALADTPGSPEIKTKFSREYASEFNVTNLLDNVFGEVADYQFVRFQPAKNHVTVLVRLIRGDGTLDYHELFLVKDYKDKTRWLDLSDTLTGELRSGVMREQYLAFLIRQQPDIFDRTTGPNAERGKHAAALTRLQNLLQQGHGEEALAIYAVLPERLRQEKDLLLTQIRAASLTGEKELEKANEAFWQEFPNDVAADLVTGNFRAGRKEYAAAAAAYALVAKKVKEDAYAQYLVAENLARAGETNRALIACEQAVARDQEFAPAHALQLKLLLDGGRFAELIAPLTAYYHAFHEDGTKRLRNEARFPDYLKSPAYPQWTAEYQRLLSENARQETALKAAAQKKAAPTNQTAKPAPAGKTPVTNVVAGKPAPKPATNDPFRLQGINYHPIRPSAIVGGNLVYVGDPVGTFTVKEITEEKVMLESARGERKELSFR